MPKQRTMTSGGKNNKLFYVLVFKTFKMSELVHSKPSLQVTMLMTPPPHMWLRTGYNSKAKWTNVWGTCIPLIKTHTQILVHDTAMWISVTNNTKTDPPLMSSAILQCYMQILHVQYDWHRSKYTWNIHSNYRNYFILGVNSRKIHSTTYSFIWLETVTTLIWDWLHRTTLKMDRKWFGVHIPKHVKI